MKGLKVALIIYAAIGILQGLIIIFAPEQGGAMLGYAKGPAYVHNFLALLGLHMIVGGAFLIVAARDPIQNILWVQYAIALAILMVAGNVYSIMRGFVTFNQAVMGIIIDGVFAMAFLALYPYRAAKNSPT